MLICAICPQCQAVHELSPKLVGDTVLCQKCAQPFVVVETITNESKTVRIDPGIAAHEFSDPESPDSDRLRKKKPRLQDGKHSLILPPPPREHWVERKKGDEPKQRFPEFRHDSKAVRKFLEREEGSDYSWLLVAGLVLTTLLVFAFLGVLIVLIVR